MWCEEGFSSGTGFQEPTGAVPAINELADQDPDGVFVQHTKSLSNTVFQDGIRTNLNGSDFAPIGSCLSVCNLTASARLNLNITRNDINYKTDKIRHWDRTVASVIRRECFRSVLNVLHRVGANNENLTRLLTTGPQPHRLRAMAISDLEQGLP